MVNREGFQENSLLKYAIHQVTDRYETRSGMKIGGLFFNKMMSLLNIHLLKRGLDIELPHTWYRYGDEVVRSCMPGGLKWDHESERHTVVEWVGDVPDAMDNESMNVIDSTITELYDRYYVNGYPSKIIREDYSHAPFEFQRNSLNIREDLFEMNHDLTTKNISEPIVLINIMNSFDNFPAAEFPDLKKEADLIHSSFKHIQEDGFFRYDTIKDLFTSFWFNFCYHLRLNPECHDNVPPNTLSVWLEERDFHSKRLMNVTRDIIIELSHEISAFAADALISEEMKKRLDEIDKTDQLIEEFSPSLSGIGDFSKQFRGSD